MIQDFIDARVSPRNVYPQSFDINDVLYWVDQFPPPTASRRSISTATGTATTGVYPPSVTDFKALRKQGVNIVAPSIPYLLTLDSNDDIVASDYARNANRARMKIITWSHERSGRIVEEVLAGSAGYYSTVVAGLENDGDMMTVVDVLARDGPDHRHVLRLARHGVLLRQLHGQAVETNTGAGIVPGARPFPCLQGTVFISSRRRPSACT